MLRLYNMKKSTQGEVKKLYNSLKIFGFLINNIKMVRIFLLFLEYLLVLRDIWLRFQYGKWLQQDHIVPGRKEELSKCVQFNKKSVFIFESHTVSIAVFFFYAIYSVMFYSNQQSS